MQVSNTVLIYSASYLLFFLVLLLAKTKNSCRLTDGNRSAADFRLLITLQASGVVLFGWFCSSFLHRDITTILIGKSSMSFIQITVTVFFAVLTILSTIQLFKKQSGNAVNLHTDSRPLTASVIVLYFSVRVLFIGTYEIWFRGWLLMDCIIATGTNGALFINICLYSLLHTVNGRQEMLACIPFGLLLCSLCLWLGAAWPAVLLHTGLTLSYESLFAKKILQNNYQL